MMDQALYRKTSGDERLSVYNDWDQGKELCVYFGSKSDDFWCKKVDKRVWFEVELQRAQGNREAEEKVHLDIKVGANIMVTEVPSREGVEGNVVEKKKVEESMEANQGKLLKYNGWST
ncbi:hypothetical protein Tco_0224142, partial [Tanacetum coccineum]